MSHDKKFREPLVSFEAMIWVLSETLLDRATVRKLAIDAALRTFDDRVECQRHKVFCDTEQFLDDLLPMSTGPELASIPGLE